MNLNDVEQLLKKYDIQTLEELEYYLDADKAGDECMDDPVENKNCINAQCYENIFVPDCRKIIEIYRNYFKDDIQSKKLFIEYLDDHTEKSKSSIENYLSCKSCNQQMNNSINHSLKISDYDFKQDFCLNLDKKFNYASLFGTDYLSIKQFLFKNHETTRDTYTPSFGQKDQTMTTEEEKKLFDLTHVSKEVLKANLSNMKNLDGSSSYKMNLALAAFDRHLVEESYAIVESLSKEKAFQTNSEFLQLKAKILSNKKRDKDAIALLENLVEITKPTINAETYNLLAASIKRDAFDVYALYGDEEDLKNKLTRAKEIYFSVYKLNNDYYPALNYIYLESMLMYMDQATPEAIAKKRKMFEEIWQGVNHQINDWWSFIANIEYLILLGNYDQAWSDLKSSLQDMEDLKVSDFNIYSTIRQLELYTEFCSEPELQEIVLFLKENI
jgi:hypothetical protein